MNDRSRVGVACLLAMLGTSIAIVDAQSVQTSLDGAPALTAVSVRPSGSPGRMRIRLNPGRLDVNGASALDLIRNAYGEPTPIPADRIAGAEPWMQDERFDILATLADGAPPLTPTNTPRALRRVLADRFNMRVRAETADGPVYFLSTVPSPRKTADRLRPTTATCAPPGAKPDAAANVVMCDAMRIKGGERFLMDGTGVTMAQLAGQLSTSPEIGRPVVDRTGLAGRYDFTLEWVPLAFVTPAPGPGAQGLSVFVALEEQFGLRLESGRAPIARLVIDSASRPSPN